jgi:hypothetical protein
MDKALPRKARSVSLAFARRLLLIMNGDLDPVATAPGSDTLFTTTVLSFTRF